MAKAEYAALLMLLFRIRDVLAVSGGHVPMQSNLDHSAGPWNLVMALWRPSLDTSSTSSRDHSTPNTSVTEYPQIQGKAIHVILDSPGEIVDLKSRDSSALMTLLQMSQNLAPLRDLMHDPLSAKTQQVANTAPFPQLQWKTVVPVGNDPEAARGAQTLPSTSVTKEQDQYVTRKGSLNLARDKMSLAKDVSLNRKPPQVKKNDDRVSTTPTLKIDINGPIYEEISTTLNTDTSISDVEDYDMRIKQTENNDKYIPKANLSSVNLVDVKLHRPATLNKVSETTPGGRKSSEYEADEKITTITRPQSPTEVSSPKVSTPEVSSDPGSISRAEPTHPPLVTTSSGVTSSHNGSTETVQPGSSSSSNTTPPHLLAPIMSPNPISSSSATSSHLPRETGATGSSSSTRATASVHTSSSSSSGIASRIPTIAETKPSSGLNTPKISTTRPAQEDMEASLIDQTYASNSSNKSSLCNHHNLTECEVEEYIDADGEEIPVEEDMKVLEERVKVMMDVMDTSTDPCDDFYQFACGNWSQVFTMRADRGVYNTFEVLREDVDEILKSLLEEPIHEEEANVTKGIKILYKSCMDTDLIESQGPEPLLDLLKELGGWPVLEGDDWSEEAFKLEEQMADLRIYNNAILVSETVGANLQDSSQNILQLDQTDLGLPGREYFLNPGDEKFRKAYFELMMKVCNLLGVLEGVAKENMKSVLDFEIELAKILVPLEARHNLTALHRKMSVQELIDEVPQLKIQEFLHPFLGKSISGKLQCLQRHLELKTRRRKEIDEIDWLYYLERVTDRRVNESTEIMVFALSYFKRLVPLLNNTSKRTVSNYLLWRFVKNRISNLGSAFQKAKQEYISVLFGMSTQPERWRTCVNYINGNLEYPLGGLFVKRYFPESSRNATEGIMAGLREALVQTIRQADWMSAATRTVAEEKVETMERHVGYPDVVLNNTALDLLYSELEFSTQDPFGNVLQMLRHHYRHGHMLLDMPVNRNAWNTGPAVVNAYYSRSKNMIMFPAGILQPPFYHPAFPMAFNFGGIGVVVGHEMSHGFDHRGRQFDKDGNLLQWWEQKDIYKFYKRASCMLDQYGQYVVPDLGLHVNAINTLGENIADNAGLKISFKAYQHWLKDHEEETHVGLLNFTNNQLFFVNFAQIWCDKVKPESLLTKLRTGHHAPNKYRVIGTLSNSEDFAHAFSCPPGSQMNPTTKCKVW